MNQGNRPPARQGQMQGANLTDVSVAQMINKDNHARETTNNNNNHITNDEQHTMNNNHQSPVRERRASVESDAGSESKGPKPQSPRSRGVSIAYADSGGRQPILTNAINLFHLGVQTISAHADKLFSTSSSDGTAAEADNDSNNGKDHRKISCYCLPCLSCGRGEQGRAMVRMLVTLIFPLFLLSFFLLDDLGRTVMRNIRLRNAMSNTGTIMNKYNDIKIRRKVLHEYPRVTREVIWVPLEYTLNVAEKDTHTQVEAMTKCPKGILFLFHGCGRYAASFFYSPQGRRIVSAAYRAGLEIVTFEKENAKGCWDWEADGESTLMIGKKFMTSRMSESCGTDDEGNDIYPPVWAFGASSGGSFIASLAVQMKVEPDRWTPFIFSAMNVQIMNPPDSLDWDIPTIFTVMEGDARTKSRVEERVSKKFQGGPFSQLTTSGKKSIHPNHFHNMYVDDKYMTEQLSKDIYKDLVEMGVVDASNNNMLKGDPRQFEKIAVASIWQKYDMAVRGPKALPFGISEQMMRTLREEEVNDANILWLIEELNVAWDEHEITSEGFDDVVLPFFFEFGRDR